MPKQKAKKKPDGLDADTMMKLEEAFSFGASDEEACFHAGITMSHLKIYISGHPEFKERKDLLKKRPTLLARQTLMRGLNTDARVALEYLDRVAGKL